MEEKKTIFDYIAKAFMVFGFTMAVLWVFCLIFGESAREFSDMFALGSKGLPADIMGQFLVLSFLIVGLRFLFFTDAVIKRMSVPARAFCMVASVLIVIVIFICVFGWFPVHMWEPWAMFFVCFSVCFIISMAVSCFKEKMENRMMAEALEREKKKLEIERKENGK